MSLCFVVSKWTYPIVSKFTFRIIGTYSEFKVNVVKTIYEVQTFIEVNQIYEKGQKRQGLNVFIQKPFWTELLLIELTHNVNSCHSGLYKTKMRINGSHSERSIVKARPTGVPFHFVELDVHRNQYKVTSSGPRKSYWWTLTTAESKTFGRSLFIGCVATNGIDTWLVY